MSTRSAKHYYQGGYDLDFVDELDQSFECPICLLCQRNPHQTTCGHRFCYSCILTWLSEGKTCPKDGCSLGDGDLFPDVMANRQILQLFVRCPNHARGCQSMMRLSDVDNHTSQCSFNTEVKANPEVPAQPCVHSVTCVTCGETVDDGIDSSVAPDARLVCPNGAIACPFAQAGCEERVARKDLQDHVNTQTQKHMLLLCERLLKLHQMQGLGPHEGHEHVENEVCSSPESCSTGGSTLSRGGSIRSSGSNMRSMQRLLKELFQRVVQLEQRNCRLEIDYERLSAQNRRNAEELSRTKEDLIGRFCQGHFTWRITQFTLRHAELRRSYTAVLYSPGFYTSPQGYRVCLRCNVSMGSDNEEHLGLFLHVMRGDYDDCLRWPLAGRAEVTVVNLARDRLCVEDFTEVLEIGGRRGQASLQRPPDGCEVNPTGLGFHEFIRVNGLHTGGFVDSERDILVIKVVMETDE